MSFIFLVSFYLVTPAPASDAIFYGDSATVFSVGKHRGVRLERETVKITHSGAAMNKDGKASAASWNADSTTTFFNPSSSAVEVTMGLPNWRSFSDLAGGDGKWAISQLTVETDGRPGVVRHEEFKFGPGTRPTQLPGKSPLFYDGGYRWAIQIASRGRVAVRTRYAFGGFSSAGSVEALRNPQSPFFVADADLFWKQAPAQHGGWDFSNSLYRTVAHLVTPGGTWAGNISETEIAIQLPPKTLPHLLVPQPSGFIVSGEFIRWAFRDWKPQLPVRVVEVMPRLSPFQKSECPSFDNAAQASAWVSFAGRSHYDRDTILAVRNAVLAKHGHRFAEKKWSDYFSQFSWYQPKDGVTLQALSEGERQALTVLDGFERRLAE